MRLAGATWSSRLGYSTIAFGIWDIFFVFMAHSIRVADQGAETLRNMLPTRFPWPLFIVALALMAMPVAELGWQGFRAGRRRQS